MTQASGFLNEILTQIRANQAECGNSLAVFDLDSTLFDVRPRLEKILTDFASDPAHQKKFPQAIELFKDLKIEKNDWGIRNSLLRAGLSDDHSELHHAVKEFWIQTFFSNEYLKYDSPYPGAVEYVQSIADLGAEIVYLTGRDVHRMGEGSVETLKNWNFPLDGKKHILELKPHRSMDDGEFKKDWFLNLPPDKYSHIWFFENEPVNIHLVQKHSPHVQIVFVDSTHSGKAEAPKDAPWIMNFLTGKK